MIKMNDKQNEAIYWRMENNDLLQYLPEHVRDWKGIMTNLGIDDFLKWIKDNVRDEDIQKLFSVTGKEEPGDFKRWLSNSKYK